MDPADLQWSAYAVPLTTRFRRVDVREGMVALGPAGWAEWSPFGDYDDVEAATWLRAALEQAEHPPPTALRSRIAVNCTVPAVGPDAARRVVTTSGGCRTAKVKVAEPGQSLADDIARVEAVADALGPGGRVRVDANGAWSVDDAVEALRLLDRAAGGLEYAEQPCATVEDLALVRRRVDVSIAADESIRRAEDPLRVRDLSAADVAVLKVQPLGGVRACLRVAEQVGLPVVVSSAVESAVGICAGLALAAALPELPYACGLHTLPLHTVPLAPWPDVVDGTLPVGRVEVDAAALTAVGDPDLQARWEQRLARVREHR